MRNRAKCKLCSSIIESYHPSDYVTCGCGEIALDGGLAMKCFANDLHNIIRLDDKNNEIIPTIVDRGKESPSGKPAVASRDDLLVMMADLIRSYEGLPDHALMSPVNHSDLQSVLVCIYSILTAKD